MFNKLSSGESHLSVHYSLKVCTILTSILFLLLTGCGGGGCVLMCLLGDDSAEPPHQENKGLAAVITGHKGLTAY